MRRVVTSLVVIPALIAGTFAGVLMAQSALGRELILSIDGPNAYLDHRMLANKTVTINGVATSDVIGTKVTLEARTALPGLALNFSVTPAHRGPQFAILAVLHDAGFAANATWNLSRGALVLANFSMQAGDVDEATILANTSWRMEVHAVESAGHDITSVVSAADEAGDLWRFTGEFAGVTAAVSVVLVIGLQRVANARPPPRLLLLRRDQEGER